MMSKKRKKVTLHELMDELKLSYEPNIIIYDIETAGVNALHADLGYVITFGWITLKDFLAGKKAKTISIADFPRFDKNPHDDTDIVKAALEILSTADGIVHHYGNKFDAPFLRTRAAILRLGTFPEPKQLDTCFLAYKVFKLSSNRLVNVAKALKCKYRKLDKGDGWPNWWLDFLKGSRKSDKPMREYCGFDVMTLAEITVRVRPYWPQDFINRLRPRQSRASIIKHGLRCVVCGGGKLRSHGIRLRQRVPHRILQCQNCGSMKTVEKLEV